MPGIIFDVWPSGMHRRQPASWCSLQIIKCQDQPSKGEKKRPISRHGTLGSWMLWPVFFICCFLSALMFLLTGKVVLACMSYRSRLHPCAISLISRFPQALRTQTRSPTIWIGSCCTSRALTSCEVFSFQINPLSHFKHILCMGIKHGIAHPFFFLRLLST